MPKARVELHPDTKRIMEEVGAEIVEKLKGEFYEVEGTPMSVVKYADGRIRQKTLLPTWLFQLEYSYVGAQGRIIFGLSPEDAQEYKWIERNPKELDDCFPLIGGAIAKAFNAEGENAATVIKGLVKARLDAKAQAEEMEKKQTEMALQNNELFGAF
ncbi:hypothetical protein B9J07_28100 [Sinorhizobium sp. LM21]|uniref:hypothetical protein n=1 Tax=Sinorhizobium sp. LM21 TaxID=1449788 RepID=UPI0005D78927|nr:hypothetical protein [Sinorhizobium sp. LM21]AJW30145.1 hypothetical protein pLM21S1_p24 [Sinorhizobium sp. LM21]OWZ90450.1 hypothetical protein B9J07_28100 [Sinorhizobium sp. LM21]